METIELPLDVAEQLSLAWMMYVRDGEPFNKEERAKVLSWIEAINKALESS